MSYININANLGDHIGSNYIFYKRRFFQRLNILCDNIYERLRESEQYNKSLLFGLNLNTIIVEDLSVDVLLEELCIHHIEYYNNRKARKVYFKHSVLNLTFDQIEDMFIKYYGTSIQESVNTINVALIDEVEKIDTIGVDYYIWKLFYVGF